MGADVSKDIVQGEKVVVDRRWSVCRARIGGKTGFHFGNLDAISVFEFDGDALAFQTNLKVDFYI